MRLISMHVFTFRVLSVRILVTTAANHANTAELIEMPFGV